MGDNTRGLYRKFVVTRTDGSSAPGQKHDGCDYFVLDLTHDPFATAAVRAYADACRAEYPLLAADLDAKPTAGPVAPPRPEESLVNPVSQVYFRAGLLACREYMARFVEAQDPAIANSIRANWWPALGQDFGPPRQLAWSEVTNGEYGTPEFAVKGADALTATQEALPVALAFLESGLGEAPRGAARPPQPPDVFASVQNALNECNDWCASRDLNAVELICESVMPALEAVLKMSRPPASPPGQEALRGATNDLYVVFCELLLLAVAEDVDMAQVNALEQGADDAMAEIQKALAVPPEAPATPPAREAPALERPVCGAFQQHPVCVLLCERCLHPLTDHIAAPHEPAKETELGPE